MKLDALLVSAAFLAGTVESFAPFSAAQRPFGRRASVQIHDTGAAVHPSRGRKRPRAHWTRMDSSSTGGATAASEGHDLPPPAPLGLPRRLQAAVEMLGRDTDLKAKSKLLVELGDAFAKTDAAVLPTPPPTGDGENTSSSTAPDAAAVAAADGWLSQKVPGCVSEVYVAVRVDKSSADDSLGAGGGGGVVSIRGTADARLSRGLLALLALGLQGQSPRTVLSLRGKSLAAAAGMRAGLTDSRINGLGNVLRVIQDQVREHFRRTAAAAAAAEGSSRAAGKGTPPPARVDPAGYHEAIPPMGRINGGADEVVAATAAKPPLQPEALVAGRPRARASEPVLADLSSTSTSTSTSAGGLDPGRSWGDDASSWYPLPGAENEVAMLLSGGVDSSVAMRLLQDQGYKIRAFYLKIWLEDELAHLNECPWEEDLAYATAVCEQAGVPLEVVPLQKEYWDQVVSYTVSEAREGRTPNPDVMCNSRIKFGMFYDHVGKHFRYVATGHYARLERPGDGGSDDTAGVGAAADTTGSSGGGGGGDGGGQGPVRLLLSPDAVKDQTYFLCALTQDQLQKALFPVGGHTKDKIRELAESYDLPTKNRKDSQGICFLGKLKFDEFLQHYLGTSPGPIVDQAGLPIGRHRGLWFHTIGQRKGLGPFMKPGVVNCGPWYVADKDMEHNVLVVTNDREAISSPREVFKVEGLQWISGQPPAELAREGAMRFRVKTRHGPQMRDCSLRLVPPVAANESGEHGGRAAAAGAAARGYVHLYTKENALAPGQFAAFYLGDECVGAGVMAGWSLQAAAAASAAKGVVPEREGAPLSRG